MGVAYSDCVREPILYQLWMNWQQASIHSKNRINFSLIKNSQPDFSNPMFKSKLRIALITLFVAMGVSGSFIYLDWYNNQEQRNIEQFMKERYGEPDEKKQFWGVYPYDGDSNSKLLFGKTICASNLDNKELKVILLVVCDKLVEEPETIDRALEGNLIEVQFFAINRSDRQFEVLAKEVVELHSGINGAPQSLAILKLGADFWGIETEKVYEPDEGVFFSSTSIHVPYKSGFKNALTMTSNYDGTAVNTSNKQEELNEDKTNNEETSTSSDPSIHFSQKLNVIDGGAEKTYKLRIKQEITTQNKTTRKTYTIDFNKKKWEYNYNKKNEEMLSL